MAELLGTVVGVISLGLQVCSGVTKYLDGIKDHRDEIASASRLCHSLQTSLDQLDDQLDALRMQVSTATHRNDSITQAMTSVNAELAVLRAFIDKVRVGDGSSRTLSEWIQDQTRRTTYPFRRSRLDRLEAQLLRASEALRTAIQVTQMAISIQADMTIRRLETNTTASERHIGGKVDNLLLQSAQGNETMTLINNNLSQIGVTFDSFKAQVQKHLEVSTAGMSQIQSQLAEIVQALDSTESEMVFKRVVSKPDALRIICDEVFMDQNQRGTMPSNENHEKTGYSELQCMGCRCKGRRTRKQMRRSFGPGFFIKETFRQKPHALGCPFYGISPSETLWSLGVSTTVLRKVLSTAITVSMSLSSGAGGLSLSPTFRLYPVNYQSPAFYILDLLGRSASMDSETFSVVLQKGLKALQWLFKTRKASPFDVDSNGNTLLHYATSGLTFYLRPRSDMGQISPLLRFLIDAGVPRDRACSNGRLPFQQLFSWMAHFSAFAIGPHTNVSEDASRRSRTQNFEFLWPSDLSLISGSWVGADYCASTGVVFLPQLTSTYPAITEWYGEHLHTIILQQDENALVKTLKNDAIGTELSETSALGFTALELLALWPIGLELVLQRLGSSAVLSSNAGSATALNCAIVWSGRNCSGLRKTRCSQSCSCTKSAILLLKAGCRMKIDYYWASGLSKASIRCQELIIQDLKSRRKQLADLALTELPSSDVERFGVSKFALLDSQTNGVIRALGRRGFDIHQRLQTEVIPRRHCCPESGSIYHVMVSTRADVGCLVDIAYSTGFHEIDVPNENNHTPIMLASNLPTFLAVANLGGNQELEIPRHVGGYTAKHLIMESVDWADTDIPGENFEIVAQNQYGLFRNPLLTDKCSCYCSVDGCHPYKTMWANYNSNWRINRRNNHLKWVVSLLRRFERHGDPDWHFKSVAIRVATFEALKIRHTCCYPTGMRRFRQTDEDIRELWEEDAPLIQILEGLVSEFEGKLAQTSVCFSEFLGTYWKDRMHRVTEEFDKQHLTDENIKGIERLGISIAVEVKDPEEEDYFYKPRYWIKELDKPIE